VLAGSRSKKLVEKDLHNNPLHGKFASYGENALMEVIDALINSGEIRVTPGMYPKVLLNPNGQQRLASLDALPL
jgi:hypothetical protein